MRRGCLVVALALLMVVSASCSSLPQPQTVTLDDTCPHYEPPSEDSVTKDECMERDATAIQLTVGFNARGECIFTKDDFFHLASACPGMTGALRLLSDASHTHARGPRLGKYRRGRNEALRPSGTVSQWDLCLDSNLFAPAGQLSPNAVQQKLKLEQRMYLELYDHLHRAINNRDPSSCFAELFSVYTGAQITKIDLKEWCAKGVWKNKCSPHGTVINIVPSDPHVPFPFRVLMVLGVAACVGCAIYLLVTRFVSWRRHHYAALPSDHDDAHESVELVVADNDHDHYQDDTTHA